MKSVKNLLALVVVLGMAGVASAKKAPAPAAGDKPAVKADHADAVKGVVSKVDGDKVTIKVGKDAKEVVIATNASTKVTIEGKEGKVSELKEGQRVTVTPANGTAASIEVKAPKAKKDAPAAAGDKPAAK